MGKLVVSTLIAMGIFAWSGDRVDAQEGTERVILADGEVYEVRTMNGVPIGASDENATIVGLGPAITTSVENSEWFVDVELHKTGHFIVHVTSYVDKEAAATFSCDGPGRVTQALFRNKEYPSMWQWLDEPGNSWVPVHI